MVDKLLIFRVFSLLVSIVILSIFCVESISSSAYASTSSTYPTLTLDQTSYYYDMSFIIKVYDPNVLGGPTTIYAQVSSGGVSCRFPLTLVDNAGTYQSPYIGFASTGSCSNVLFVLPTAPSSNSPVTITVSYSPQNGGTAPPPVNANVVSDDPFPPPTLFSGAPPVLWGKQTTDCTQWGGDLDKDGICANWKDQTKHNGLWIPYLAPTSSSNLTAPLGYYKLPCDPNASLNPHSKSPNWYDSLGDMVCPGTDKPDIYVQVDWLKAQNPDVNALADVVQAFANSPLKTCDNEGNCATGIRLHLILSNAIPDHYDAITTPFPGSNGNTQFDTIKQLYFGTGNEGKYDPTWVWQQNLTSKKQVFHYALFIHSQATAPTSSGISEIPGNDIIISLGRFTGNIGSTDQQEGTFMHELGHNLGLYHSGNVAPTSTLPDPDNCKPNYLSIMSYARQFNESFPIDRPLDYSHNKLPALDESAIVENNGIGLSSPANLQSVYGVSTGRLFETTIADDIGFQNLSWIPFENTLSDISGNRDDGIFHSSTGSSPVYVLGRVGNAISLDSSSYVSLSDSSFPSGNSPFTISFWVNPSSVSGGAWQTPFSYGTPAFGEGFMMAFDGATNDGTLTIGQYGQNVLTSNAKIPVNQWTYVAATFDGTTLRLYVNGLLDNSVNTSFNTVPNSAAVGELYGGGQKFTGSIDELRIWNYAMLPDDFQTFGQHGLDANGDGIIYGTTSGDINKIGTVTCDGSEINLHNLTGFDDWDHLQINSNLAGWSSWLGGERTTIGSGAKLSAIGAGVSASTTGSAGNNPQISGTSSSMTINFNAYTNSTSLQSSISNAVLALSPNQAFDYREPTLSNATEKNRLETWLKTWAWELPHNKPYFLPNEFTLEDLREIRSMRINSIMYNAFNPPNHHFLPTNTTFTIQNDLNTANQFVMQDDLYDTNQQILKVKQYVVNASIDPYVKTLILADISKELDSLKIASTTNATGPHQPLKCPSTLELDQVSYTWTSQVYITLVSPCHDLDPNLIDTVTVKVSDNNHSLGSYHLAETGVDTGIFTGYVILTGDPSLKGPEGVDGSGANPSGAGPSGSGPTNGLLPAESNDTINVAFQDNYTNISKSASIKWTLGKTVWLQSSYPNGGTGVLQIADPDMDLSPKDVDTFKVNVWSDSDPDGVTITMIETGQNTGIFQGIVHFTSQSQSSGSTLLAQKGDTVTARYTDRTLPPPYLVTDQKFLFATTQIQ